MSSQRKPVCKPLSPAIQIENQMYRRDYEARRALAATCNLFELRKALATCFAYGRPLGNNGSTLEAIVSALIDRGDAPLVVGPSGKRWA